MCAVGVTESARKMGSFVPAATGKSKPTNGESSKGPLTPDSRTFPIIEIFGPTTQGEGRMTGVPVHFIRTGGCDYRCSWCDTPFAVLPDQVRKNAVKMTATQIVDTLNDLEGDPGAVVISGGNPVMHELAGLVGRLRANGYHVSTETQGSRYKDWLLDVDLLTVSPKPPSSGMNTDWDMLSRVIDRRQKAGRVKDTDIKVVAFNEEDMVYAKRVFKTFPQTGDGKIRHFLSLGTLVGTDTRDEMLDRLRDLIIMGTRDKDLARVTFSCQMHVLLFGHVRGV